MVSVLPPGELQVISVDYTTPNGQDDTATLLRTLKDRFKSGLDDAVVDVLPIRRPPESNLRSAVVAVAPRERVIAHLDLLQSAGLEPVAVDIGPAALARVARALVTGPSLLLADEPTGNLDTARSREIMDLLAALNRDQGITVVMVTHEADMAAYAHRIVRLVDGRIASDERREPGGQP